MREREVAEHSRECRIRICHKEVRHQAPTAGPVGRAEGKGACHRANVVLVEIADERGAGKTVGRRHACKERAQAWDVELSRQTTIIEPPRIAGSAAPATTMYGELLVLVKE